MTGDTPFDSDFLRALQNGDPGAQNLLVNHFFGPIRSRLRRLLARYSDKVEDACQETFLRVLKHFRDGKDLKDSGSLPGFVFGVSRYVALEYMRVARPDQFLENAEDPADSAPSPEVCMVTEERKAGARRVLAKLKNKDQVLLRRAYLDDEDKDEICGDLGVKREYLRVLLHRAIVHFRKEAVVRFLATYPVRNPDRELLQRAFIEQKNEEVVCRELGVTQEYLYQLLQFAVSQFGTGTEGNDPGGAHSAG